MSPRGRRWLLVASLAVVHLFLHVGLSFGRGAPDLFTLAVLLAARDADPGRSAILGLCLGLLEDALSVLAFGANSVAMTVVAIGGALTRDLFVGDSRFFLASYLFVGKWLRDAVHWVAVGEGARQPFVEQVIVGGGIASVYVVIVGYALTSLFGLSREAA